MVNRGRRCLFQAEYHFPEPMPEIIGLPALAGAGVSPSVPPSVCWPDHLAGFGGLFSDAPISMGLPQS
jgi:hypothetical protein